MMKDPNPNLKPSQESLDIKIETAKPEEWRELKAIRLEALTKNPEAFGSSFEEEVANFDKYWKDLLESRDKFFMLVRYGESVVGLAGARSLPLLDEKVWRVYSVYVNEQFRGGTGEKLMKSVLEQIRQRQGSKITLNVIKGPNQERALALYTKLGFKIRKEETYTDMVCYEMELDLTPKKDNP